MVLRLGFGVEFFGLQVAATLGPQHVIDRLGRKPEDEEQRAWLRQFLSQVAGRCSGREAARLGQVRGWQEAESIRKLCLVTSRW